MIDKYLILLFTTTILACSISSASGQENAASEITFACENNNGVPITIAKNQEGKTQTIFHWKEEVLKEIINTRTPAQICSDVTSKMNQFASDGYNLSDFSLIGTKVNPFSVLCLNESIKDNNCLKVLFAFVPKSESTKIINAQYVLKKIVDSAIIDSNRKYRGAYSERDHLYVKYRVFLPKLFKINQNFLI